MLSVKAWILARREYLALVRTKAFLLGLFMAPTLMAISLLLIPRGNTPEEGAPREVVLVDYSRHVAQPLIDAARAANITITDYPESIYATSTTTRQELDQKVQNGTIAAVLVVQAHAIEGQPSDGGSEGSAVLTVRNAASRTAVWLQHALNDVIRMERMSAAGIERTRAQQILSDPGVQIRSPASTGESSRNAALKATIVPLFTLMLVFMTIMSSAPYMLHSVIEEKQQRIAEVLLGSMSPFQLMSGKLIGAAGAGLTVLAIYASMGIFAASYYGVASILSPMLLLMALADVLLALVMFGSLFLAAGATATEIKEAQGLMTPLMLIVFLPMMALSQLLTNPDGQLATTLTLFPLTAPMILPLRLATTTVPTWQLVVSIGGALLTTIAVVWIAGRIFRIGILAQGRAPKLRELVQWIRMG
jgi:ABC-2 type transport system permease protein